MPTDQPSSHTDVSAYVPDILRKSNLFYVLITSMEGVTVYVNDLYKSRFSFISDSLEGRYSEESIHPEHLERNRQAAKDCIDHPGKVVRVILRKAQNYLGVNYLTSWEYSLLRNAEGKPLGIYCLGYDITEAEQQGRRAKLLNDKLGRIIDELPIAYYHIDNNWTIDQVNETALRQLRMKRESFEGKSLWEVFPQSEELIYPDCFRRAMAGKVPVHFEEHSKTSGHWFSIEVYPSGMGISVYFRDITERKNTEMALQKREAELREITERMSDMIWTSDLDFNISYVSPSVERLTRGSAERWMTIPITEKYPPHIIEHFYNVLKAELENDNKPGVDKNRSHLVEGQEYRADGSLMDISVNVSFIRNEKGEPIGLQGLSRDITGPMDVFRELVRTKELLEQTGQMARVGGFRADLLTGEVHWSKVTKEIHEVGDNFIPTIENAVDYYKIGPHRDRIKAYLSEAFETGQPFDDEFQILTDSGKELWVRVIARTEFEGERCVSIYGTFQDITERKKALEEQQMLLSLTKGQNERLKNFAYIVSHNLRTHAGNIESLLQLLASTDPGFQALELSQMMLKASHNLSDTISQLSEVAGLGSLDLEKLHPVRLFKVVEQAMSHVAASSLAAGVQIENQLKEDLAVMGLQAYLESVVLNLLTNAIKYRSTARKSHITMSSFQHDGYTALVVKDNGQGIDMSLYGHKLFGMYNTFHNNPDAQGVGLFITKNQVESMGGYIEVESQPDEGTIFKVYLKRAHS